MYLRWGAITLMGAALLFAACYSPNIATGSYACGSDGGCPDKFHCASNHICYSEADANICKSDASAPQVCNALHASGQACNPGCQTGCDGCGWCAVVNGATKCLTGKAGTKDVGAVCTPSLQSDCMPGLYCQPECGTGRCYRICDATDRSICGAGSMCNLAGNSGTFSFTLCSLAAGGMCDAVAQTGCAAPAFACYPTVPTECDCPGTVATGQPCIFAADCERGASCIGLTMTTKVCLQTCKGSADCTSGTCMNASPYGYCMM
jgi:hypothetical protein